MTSPISVKSYFEGDVRRFSLSQPSSAALLDALRTVYQLPASEVLRVRLVLPDGTERDLEFGDLASFSVGDVTRVRLSLDAAPTPLFPAVPSARGAKEARKQLRLMRREQRISERLVRVKGKCMERLQAAHEGSCARGVVAKPHYYRLSDVSCTEPESRGPKFFRPMQVVRAVVLVNNDNHLLSGSRCFLQQFHCTAPNSLCNVAPYSVACFTPLSTTLVPVTLVMPSACGSFKYSFRLISCTGERLSKRLVIRFNVVNDVERAHETFGHLLSLGFEDSTINSNAIGKSNGDLCLATNFALLKNLRNTLRLSALASECDIHTVSDRFSSSPFSSSSASCLLPCRGGAGERGRGVPSIFLPRLPPSSVEQRVDLKLEKKVQWIERMVAKAHALLDDVCLRMANRGVPSEQVRVSRDFVIAAINKAQAKKMKKLAKKRARLIRKEFKRIKRSSHD